MGRDKFAVADPDAKLPIEIAESGARFVTI